MKKNYILGLSLWCSTVLALTSCTHDKDYRRTTPSYKNNRHAIDFTSYRAVVKPEKEQLPISIFLYSENKELTRQYECHCEDDQALMSTWKHVKKTDKTNIIDYKKATILPADVSTLKNDICNQERVQDTLMLQGDYPPRLAQ